MQKPVETTMRPTATTPPSITLVCLLLFGLLLTGAAAVQANACRQAEQTTDANAALKQYTDCLSNTNLDQASRSRAYLQRGQVYYRMGHYLEAITDFSQAAQDSRISTSALTWRAMTYQQRKRYVAAIKDFSSAIALAPGSARLYCQRGDVYRITRHYSQAIDDYSQSLAIDPSEMKCRLSRAELYSTVGRHDEADQDYARILATNPNNPAAIRGRDHNQSVKQRPREPIVEAREARQQAARSTRPAPQPSNSAAKTSASLKETQRLLSTLGYRPGPIDGSFGARTRRAIEAFQHDASLTANGQPSAALLGKLQQRAADTTSDKATATQAPAAIFDDLGDLGDLSDF